MDADDRRGRVAKEAAEWWVLLQRDMTHQQREQFVDWLRESSLHVTEMLLADRIHGALETFERWAQIPTDGAGKDDDAVLEFPIAAAPAPLAADADNSRGFWARPLTWAASAMLIGSLVATLWMIDSRGRIIETGHAESREVALADGSMMEIDPETRVRVRYERHDRRVFLERGRVLFHVAENTRRPFLVEAYGTAVRDLGTTFAVEQDADSIVVTVAQGRVTVVPGFDAGADSLWKLRQGNQRQPAAPNILLTANQQVTVTRSGKSEPVRAVDSSRVLAWAVGRLIFANDSISDAVDQFNRYNLVQLSVSDAQLGRRRLSGVFTARDPGSFVQFIQAVTAVQVKRDAAGNFILKSAR